MTKNKKLSTFFIGAILLTLVFIFGNSCLPSATSFSISDDLLSVFTGGDTDKASTAAQATSSTVSAGEGQADSATSAEDGQADSATSAGDGQDDSATSGAEGQADSAASAEDSQDDSAIWAANLPAGIKNQAENLTIFRKFSHFMEFFVLGAEISIFTAITFSFSLSNTLHVFSFGLLCAVIDETIQIYSKRTPAVKDVLIDFSGFLCGCFIIIIVYALRKKFKNEL